MVKARNRRHPALRDLPVLWVFSDPARLPDPRPVIAILPPGLCGVVLRDAGERALVESVARACRARRIALTLTNSCPPRLTLGMGLHLRRGARAIAGAGRTLRKAGRTGLVTASAHDARELRAGAQAGAAVIFLSPLFATASHAGAQGLGPRRWVALARSCPAPVAALGGMGNARALAALPKSARGLGVISPFDRLGRAPGL